MTWKLFSLIISTLGFGLFLTLQCQVRLLVAPFLTICLIVLTLYMFALCGILSFGVWIVVIAGIASGLYVLFSQKAQLTEIKAKFKITDLFYVLFLIPFVLLYLAIANDFMFLIWDELSFWARSQRLMFDTNALIQANSPISFKNYPPGQQLFQYFLTVMIGWSEKNILFAQDVFLLSGLMALVGIFFKKLFPALLMFIASLTVIYFFHADYVTIYSDSLISIFFVVGLALACNAGNGSKVNWVLMLVLSVFVLIKEVAVIFVVIVLAVYTVSLLLSQYQSGVMIKSKLSSTAFSVFLVVLPVALVFVSWRWYVGTLLIEPNGVPPLSISSYGQEALRPRLDKTIAKMLEAIKKPGYFSSRSLSVGLIDLSLIQLFAWLSALGVIIVAVAQKGQRLKYFVILFLIAAGAVAYHLFLLWTYLFYFTEYEGVRLASFDRYSWTYMLSWTLLAVSLLTTRLNMSKIKMALVFPVLLVMAALYWVPNKFYADFTGIRSEPVALGQKKKVIALADQVKKYIKPGERVYFIAQNTNGYEKHMFDYEMIPFLPNNCWSVGAKYNEGDVWSCDRPLEELISGYDYLAIYNADQRFWDDNAGLFPVNRKNSQQGIYKIISRDGKVAALQSVN